jgi:hypothetical protein
MADVARDHRSMVTIREPACREGIPLGDYF